MKENTREISILKQRILQYLDSKQVSKYECYKNTGITNGVLSQTNGMSEDNILRFLSYYNDISSDWLLLGHGSMLRNISEQAALQPTAQSISSTDESFIYKMYKEEKEEKEKLLKENGRLEERLRQLESRENALERPSISSQIAEAFTSESSGGSAKDSTHTKKPTISKTSSVAKT